MKVLVTGGAGFIGSHVVERLLDLGHMATIAVLDIDRPGKVEHLSGKINFVEGDIRNYDDCVEAVEGADAVVHMATLINVGHSIRDPLAFYETNVRGTMNLLEAVRNEPSVQKFVYMSSVEVYGTIPEGRLKETGLCDPRSPYAASKYAAERYCLSHYYTYRKPEITVVRGSNTFGPRQAYGARGAVFAIFITNVLKREPPIIFGSGEQQRDYLYVKDMARGIVDVTLARGLGGEIINLASGETISVNEIADAVLDLTNSNLRPRYVRSRLGEVMRSCGDSSKAKKLVDWEAKTPFLQGLKETIEYFRVLFGNPPYFCEVVK